MNPLNASKWHCGILCLKSVDFFHLWSRLRYSWCPFSHLLSQTSSRHSHSCFAFQPKSWFHLMTFQCSPIVKLFLQCMRLLNDLHWLAKILNYPSIKSGLKFFRTYSRHLSRQKPVRRSSAAPFKGRRNFNAISCDFLHTLSCHPASPSSLCSNIVSKRTNEPI